MADETLRRNLDSAFDPGPGFPDPLLLSRTMAILNAEATSAGPRPAHRRAPRVLQLEVQGKAWALALVATLVAVAIVATLIGVGVLRFSAPTPAGPKTGKGDQSILWQGLNSSGVSTLYLVRPDGSALHALVPGFTAPAYQPDWSPDGQRVAFSSERADPTHGLNAARNDLWIVNADGTMPQRLITCNVPCNTVGDPDWSSDGRTILFVQDDLPAGPGGVPTSFEFKVLDLASGTVTTILSERDGMPIAYPRWSPDNRQIVFTRGRLSASGDEIGAALFVIDLAGGHERQLTTWDTFAAHPDWGPDGRIVFSTYDPGDVQQTLHASNLFLINPDGTGLKGLTAFATGTMQAFTPRWTPDGSAIIFADNDAAGVEIMTIKADGTGLRTATPTGLEGIRPEVRPGG